MSVNLQGLICEDTAKKGWHQSYPRAIILHLFAAYTYYVVTQPNSVLYAVSIRHIQLHLQPKVSEGIQTLLKSTDFQSLRNGIVSPKMVREDFLKNERVLSAKPQEEHLSIPTPCERDFPLLLQKNDFLQHICKW